LAPLLSPSHTGGAQAVKIGVNASNGIANISVNNDAGGDFIRLETQAPSGVDASSSLTSFVLFDAGGTSYGDLTGISGRTAGGVSGALESRFMIETTSGDFYLSDTSITGGFGGATWSIPDLETETWAAFNPGEDVWRGDYGSLSFDDPLAGTTEIANIGWFATRTTTGGQNTVLTVREFEVMAIPEPGTLMLLGISLGALLLFKRRNVS